MKDTLVDVLVFLGLAIVYVIEAIVQLFIPASYRSKDVSGDIVLITGGGGGLGRLLAQRFAKLGSIIVVWDINQQGIDETVELVKSEGGTAYGYICDITNRDHVYKTAQDVKSNVGKVSILINNAGMVSGRPLLDTPDHLIQKTFDVNIISHFWTTKAFLPDMMTSRRGHIVTIASMAGMVGMSKLVDYCASKYAAVGFDDALRLELQAYGHHNVQTTAICPYFIKSTGMFGSVDARFVPILEATYVADKIVSAVRTNEKRVYLPGFFRALILLKGFFPSSVESMFLRSLVQDAHPDSLKSEAQQSDVQFAKVPPMSEALRETAAESLQYNYRNISSSERKP